MSSESRSYTEAIYELLNDDEFEQTASNVRVEDAVPKNYVLKVANGACTKWAEQLAGPNLVLPWLITVLGAPVFLVGWMMPVKQTGSLLPQLFVSGKIHQFERRKWFWVGAGLTQAVLLAAMILCAVALPATAAGIAIVGLLLLFSIASGVGSVAFQDVMGKAIPKGQRGQMLANRAVIGGGLTVLTAVALKVWFGQTENLLFYLGLIGAASVLWGLSAFIYAKIEEPRGKTSDERNLLQEVRVGIRKLSQNGNYRKYLYARSALLSIEISTPFYVLHARTVMESNMSSLAILVATVGIAKVASSRFWGRFADLSSRRVMIYSGALGALTGLTAIGMTFVYELWSTPYLYAVAFLVLGLSEAGVRLGRKTFLIDAVPAQERPTYVSFSNSIMGALTLVFGGLGFVAHFFNIHVLILILILLSLLGATLSYFMSEASEFSDG